MTLNPESAQRGNLVSFKAERHKLWSRDKVVFVSLARYESFLSEHETIELTLEEIIIISKALGMRREPLTEVIEIMNLPNIIEEMLGQNAATCQSLPKFKRMTLTHWIRAIERAEAQYPAP